MADLEDIPNWLRLDAQFTTSGQPSEAQLAAIRGIGARHVVNLGLHSHAKALPDERASVERLGMRYTHIPVAFDNPTDADFARFCTVIAELGDTPAHIHCIANYRVSAFFYRYRRDVLGWDEARARADMDRIWLPDTVWQRFVER